MRGRIGFLGIGTGGGVTGALHSGIAVAPGQQANFTGFDKLAAQTTVEGVFNLFGGATATARAFGVFTDCSPKGDTGTIETQGFVEVAATTLTGIAIGDFVTPDAANPGKVKEATASGFPVGTEQAAGIWMVHGINTADTKVLIKIDDRI